MTNKMTAGLTVILVGAALMIALPTTAEAERSPSPAGAKSTVRQGLRFVGFDRAVAAAYGYKIITLASGAEQSVPVAASSRLPSLSGAVPDMLPGGGGSNPAQQDTVWGDCGYSYIEGFITGKNQIELSHWWPNLYQHLYSIDQVVTASEVIETNGALCSSVGPIISVDGIPQ